MNKLSEKQKAYIKNLKFRIDSLSIFSGLKNDPVISSLRRLLDTLKVADYSNMVSSLYPHGDNLSEYIRDITLRDDNFYIKAVAFGKEPAKFIIETVKNELVILEDLAALSPDNLQRLLLDDYSITGERPLRLPSWQNSKLHLSADFHQKLSSLSETGYGIFARYTFFRLVGDEIVPVAHPDYQNINQLFAYERERNLIIRNTEALIDGSGSSNMLLYGDMGTGKSSTIKAVAAAFSDRGLRIIEIKKNQLFKIPDIMDQLASNPLKFILFIDDLSFAGNDNNFSALKATLEGSISGCGNNTVIYATSNRRHLVRELASDRYGAGIDDELHINDTLQETMSLAARFGLTITFQKPDKDDYLAIVRSLADEYGIIVSDAPAKVKSSDSLCKGTTVITEEELFRRAEAHAIRRNGRSPRTARQFIELLKIGI